VLSFPWQLGLKILSNYSEKKEPLIKEIFIKKRRFKTCLSKIDSGIGMLRVELIVRCNAKDMGQKRRHSYVLLRDMKLTQIARFYLHETDWGLRNRDCHCIIYKIACFQPNTGPIMSKHSIIWNLQIYSIKADPGKLNIGDCLVIGSSY